MVMKKLRKIAPEYYCEMCDYSTCRKSSCDKHLLTAKHLMVVNGSEKVAKSCKWLHM